MPRIDLAAYAGKEQAYVKHDLLERYLAPFVYKIGSAWESIVYIDGFSGPWQVNDSNLADTSFAVALDTLRRAHSGVREAGKEIRMQTILVEERKEAFGQLEKFAAAKTAAGFDVCALQGEFIDQIPAIDQIVQRNCPNPFRFVFLDPKGWSDIPMSKLAPFLKNRSCEVLINLMTRHIIRFLDEPDRADSYNNLFGRPGVLEKLRTIPKENDGRTEQAVREYCRSLRDLCGFKYVSSAVILEPEKESARYFLVYATNDFHGIEVFKQAETAAARTQDNIRHETRLRKTSQNEFSFEDGPPKSRVATILHDRYRRRAREKVLGLLERSRGPEGVSYKDLYCEAMAFPLVTPEDLENWVCGLAPRVELRLAGSGKRRKPSPGQDDRVIVTSGDRLGSPSSSPPKDSLL